MAPARRYTSSDLSALQQRALTNPRHRANLNIHPELPDPVQRMLNCFQPGTYVRPHHHEEDRWELFALLSGRLGVLTFDPAGKVLERIVMAPDACWALELPGGTVHTVVSLAPGTVVLEIKPGPFRPVSDKDFAPWSLAEGDPHAAILLWEWERLFA